VHGPADSRERGEAGECGGVSGCPVRPALHLGFVRDPDFPDVLDHLEARQREDPGPHGWVVQGCGFLGAQAVVPRPRRWHVGGVVAGQHHPHRLQQRHVTDGADREFCGDDDAESGVGDRRVGAVG